MFGYTAIAHRSVILILNSFLYGRNWWSARKQKISMQDQDQQQNAHACFDKTTCMVFVIVFLSSFLWCPYIILSILGDQNLLQGSRITFYLGQSTCIINVIIYVVMNKDFRNALKKLFSEYRVRPQ